jgi:hypothetical protein
MINVYKLLEKSKREPVIKLCITVRRGFMGFTNALKNSSGAIFYHSTAYAAAILK